MMPVGSQPPADDVPKPEYTGNDRALRSDRGQRWAFGWWHEVSLALLLMVLLTIAGVLMPSFLRWDSQWLLSRQLWELAILSLGMTLIIITGGIDLSIGAAMGLCAVMFGWTHATTQSVGLACLACLATGIACGSVNGLLIAGARVHPLIVTLATLAAFRGIAEGFSQGNAYSRFGESFAWIARGTLWGIPWTGLLTAALAVLFAVVLRATPTGRYLYAIGHQERAALFAGIPVARLKGQLYVLSGFLAGVATLIYVSRFDTAKADAGKGFELEVITAVVVGGTSIFGGRGNILGTVLGLLLIHETRLFVSRYWRTDELRSVVIGFLLIVAVLVYQVLARRRGAPI
jgi:rhamnose transport system permease protein